MLTESLMKRTLPSANAKLHPPGWLLAALTKLDASGARLRAGTAQATAAPWVLFRVGGDDRIEKRESAFTKGPEFPVVLFHTGRATSSIS